jgi:hypothetical protein
MTNTYLPQNWESPCFLPHLAVTPCALFPTKYSEIMQGIHVTLIPQPDACTTFELDGLPLQINSFLDHRR